MVFEKIDHSNQINEDWITLVTDTQLSRTADTPKTLTTFSSFYICTLALNQFIKIEKSKVSYKNNPWLWNMSTIKQLKSNSRAKNKSKSENLKQYDQMSILSFTQSSLKKAL